MPKEPADQDRSDPREMPRHPAARPRAEADRELVPPDADLDRPEEATPQRR